MSTLIKDSLESKLAVHATCGELASAVADVIIQRLGGATLADEVSDAERLLSASELAQRLSVSSTTVHKMTKAGKLPVRKVGDSPRYLWSEVLAATGSGGK
ncbi:MAG: helix-turn-helix domain-containing protein [Polyangiaceae bacterium]|nr:helix-turn-helix domain-containing protein [Polyangiaceae bacterium]